jgi:flagellar basal-body rod modification protein FlgD
MSVVGAKIGTKVWSEAPQNEISRNSEGKNLNSAKDLEKLGGQEVGDILNKIADPNYVDPSKKVRAVGSDKMDKDAFMKLMLAQMKNQDPTNPMKSHEMAAQLAQFSSLEQLQNVNTTLGEIQKGQKPSEGFQALNFIGKAVSGDSAKVIRLKGDKDHEFDFTLPEDAKDFTLQVRNQSGETIRKVDLHDLKKGDNKWVWNGKNDIGNAAPVGEYQFVVEAKGTNNKKLFVKTDFSGMISGVSYTSEGPVLMVGSQTVKLKDVKKILDPSIKSNGQKTTNVVAPDLKTGQGAAENEEKGAEEAAPSADNLMTSVGMSNGMMEKFKNDMTPQQASAPKAQIIPESKQVKAESSEGAPASKKPALHGLSTGGRS